MEALTILLEADASGLTSTFSSAMRDVVGFVDKLNTQEINWKKIMAGTLDTAIIGGIASTFATAITQAVQFQNSMMNVSNNTTSTLGGNMGQLTSQVAALAGSTGAPLTDTASAFFALQKQFGSLATSGELTKMIGQLALVSNTPLKQMMPEIIDLFNQWGITTLPQATDALTGLINEAGKGKFTLNELIQNLAPQGQALQGVTSISKMAVQMQALSNQAGMSKETVLNTFNAIAAGVANPLSQIDLLAGNMKNLVKSPEGLIAAFQHVSTTIKNMGAAGVTIAQQWGLSAPQAALLGTQTAAAFSNTKKAAAAATASMKPFETIVEANLSAMDKLSQDWQGLMGALTTSVGIPILKDLDNMVQDIKAVQSGKVTWADFWSSVPSGIGQVASGIAQGAAWGAKQVWNAAGGLANVTEGAIQSSGQWAASQIGITPPSSPGAAVPRPVSNATQTTINTTLNIPGSALTTSNPLLLGQALGKHVANAAYGLQ